MWVDTSLDCDSTKRGTGHEEPECDPHAVVKNIKRDPGVVSGEMEDATVRSERTMQAYHCRNHTAAIQKGVLGSMGPLPALV